MAKHKLSLEIPDTLNSCILRVVDTSIYNPDITVTCPLLQITVPGFSMPVFIDNVLPNFSLNLSACLLKIQSQNCNTTYNDLPDGIYIIKWSIAPNDYVYVEYNHLRITKALNKIKNIYCELDLGACEPDQTIKKKLAELREIQSFLEAAKAKVEYCREVKKGIELYKYALERLNKITCRTCK